MALTFELNLRMWVLGIFLGSIVIAAVGAAPAPCDSTAWNNFKNEYSKQYKDAADEQSHMNTFCENVAIINAHNLRYERNEVTSTMGINQFADLTEEEFARTHHGIRI